MHVKSTLGTPSGSAAVAVGGTTRYLQPAGRWVAHFVEMCAAMCVGGIALDFAFFQGVAALGYPNFFAENRELSVLILGINWAIAMFAWMAFRGHPLRHNLEMSSTSIVAALLLIGAGGLFGFGPSGRIPGWIGQAVFQCGPTCLVMGAYMLVNYRHYTGGAHRAHDAMS